jgi:hypothetical protein
VLDQGELRRAAEVNEALAWEFHRPGGRPLVNPAIRRMEALGVEACALARIGLERARWVRLHVAERVWTRSRPLWQPVARTPHHGDNRHVRLAPFVIAAVLAQLALAAAAGAEHSRLEQITAGEIGGNGFFFPNFKGSSADGSRAFFETDEKLVPEDMDNSVDVYERFGGQTLLVSQGETGGTGAGQFRGASADGTRVFFTTAEALVSEDGDAARDVYERSGGQTRLVSAGVTGGNGPFGASFAGASEDGTRVFFHTQEQLVDSDRDAAQDIYERFSGVTRRVSAGETGENGAFAASFGGASTDGTRVFFQSAEQLVAADTDAATDVYQRAARTTTLLSTGGTGGNANLPASFRGSSVDGTRVFFHTEEPLVQGDTDTAQDVYKRELGQTRLISVAETSAGASAGFAGSSADGTHVFFGTHGQFVPEDTDGRSDLYERYRGDTKLVSTGEISRNGPQNMFWRGASSDGLRVRFATKEQVLPGDTDVAEDIYERSGGQTRLLSAGEIGGNGDQDAEYRDASADGSRVFFVTPEKLVPGDMDGGIADVYERSGGVTTKVSPGNIGQSYIFDIRDAHASTDGSAVFFLTREQLVLEDTDSVDDYYGVYLEP